MKAPSRTLLPVALAFLLLLGPARPASALGIFIESLFGSVDIQDGGPGDDDLNPNAVLFALALGVLFIEGFLFTETVLGSPKIDMFKATLTDLTITNTGQDPHDIFMAFVANPSADVWTRALPTDFFYHVDGSLVDAGSSMQTQAARSLDGGDTFEPFTDVFAATSATGSFSFFDKRRENLPWLPGDAVVVAGAFGVELGAGGILNLPDSAVVGFSAIPEPTTLALLLLGGGGLLVGARRSRRARPIRSTDPEL